jgi:exodeoxyribonuclease VII small subunit
MSVKNKTIADKTIELNKLVEWFDGDNFSLEEAIDKYQQAEKLAKEIEQDLLSLKNEIQVVKKKFDE